MNFTQTIFALSTSLVKSGVAVIRISGINALAIGQKLSRSDEMFLPRQMQLQKLYSSKGELIDNAMLVFFQAPASFTGEDVVELHTHGSIAVIKMLYQTLLEYGATYNMRVAEAGEFSKRAFLNNKMDLTAAEGLADLIEAETIMQQRQAVRQMNGEFEALCAEWRGQLLKIQGLVEAYIDFPDEDIPGEVLENSQQLVSHLICSLTSKLNDNRRGERLRQGLVLAVIGEPNVGKSSLINYLAQREVAIVSEIAGTTRDIIETHLDIGGYPFILADTAGIRDISDDIIEIEGIKRAERLAGVADIKLIMVDAKKNYKIENRVLVHADDSAIIIVNKTDLQPWNGEKINSHTPIPISIKTKTNLDQLLTAIIAKAEQMAAPFESPAITRERHRLQIKQAVQALEQCDLTGDLVLAAEDVRIAARCLDMLTGKIEVEEILGEIFGNFCIGK